jgi:hypothetical protein
MVKNILLGFASIALAVASAATSYHVTFYQPVMINGSELNAGDYKLELKDKTATIRQGKTVTEVPVTVENDSQKYQRTAVRLNGMQVEEIHIGGTNTRVVFQKASSASTSNAATPNATK